MDQLGLKLTVADTVLHFFFCTECLHFCLWDINWIFAGLLILSYKDYSISVFSIYIGLNKLVVSFYIQLDIEYYWLILLNLLPHNYIFTKNTSTMSSWHIQNLIWIPWGINMIGCAKMPGVLHVNKINNFLTSSKVYGCE